MAFINPTQIDTDIEKLLKRIGTEYEPEIVPVIVESYSKEGNCYTNVELKVSKDGGRVHYGWAIHKTLLLCEAERHAVWETIDEDLIDITPNEKGFQQIMFVSDNDLNYEDQYIDSIRINITANPVVNDLIIVRENLGTLYSRGRRFDDENVIVSEHVMILVSYFRELETALLEYIYAGGNPNQWCFCGSMKIYKNCHAMPFKYEPSEKMDLLNKALLKRKK